MPKMKVKGQMVQAGERYKRMDRRMDGRYTKSITSLLCFIK